MKKIIALSILAVSMAPCVFGQGYLQISSSKSQVYDGFTSPGTNTLTANVDVALLWAANNQANPMPGALGNSLVTGNSLTPSATAGFTDAGAWNAIYPSGTILGGWTLALDNGDNGDGAAGTQIIMQSSSKGVIVYDSGAGFDITGTPAGGNVALMLLSWNDAYTSPSVAAGAGSAIGWSYMGSFALVGSATSTSIASFAPANFGTFIPGIPEPTTLALAGLGGLSLLLFRRKKA